jgi:hypothetical protein
MSASFQSIAAKIATAISGLIIFFSSTPLPPPQPTQPISLVENDARTSAILQVLHTASFSDLVSAIPTNDWHTYTSRFGYQIQYPPDWTVFDCEDGVAVLFFDQEVPQVCDSPSGGAALMPMPLVQPES